MILAIDTSTAACSAALFDASGSCIAAADEVIGRGHAERLVPMLEELLGGRRAGQVLVGVGPGSFTGIRVGIAAAHGLAIGWGCGIAGMSSLALLAAAADSSLGSAEVGVAMDGGHGELFVQQFDSGESGPLLNLPPAEAAQRISAERVIGPAAERLVEARGFGEAIPAWPSARYALDLRRELRSLPAKPVYARAPDAKARAAA